MRIRIYIQPDTKDAFWAKLSQKAVAAEILHKRYTPVYIEAPTAADIDFDKVFDEGEKRVLLYIGYSVQKTPADLSFLAENGIHTLLLNYGFPFLSSSCSRVLLNYRDTIEKCIAYLVANGRGRIALFGINPSSSTDRLKEQYFSEHPRGRGEGHSRDVYYNYASIGDCYADFSAHCAAYNAVICANDITALTLLRRLKADGVRVPEDMYIMSCGITTMLAERPTTSITTVSADLSEIGTQAVFTYAMLMKNPGDISLTVRIAPKLTVRASTDFAPDPKPDALSQQAAFPTLFDFYADPIAQNFFSAENLLLGSDELDHGILDGILAGDTYPVIAERLFTSENVISYRIKRMCRLTGCTKKSELIELLKPYID